MLAFVRDGDTVLVHLMDRLARNLDDLRALVRTLTGRVPTRARSSVRCWMVSWRVRDVGGCLRRGGMPGGVRPGASVTRWRTGLGGRVARGAGSRTCCCRRGHR